MKDLINQLTSAGIEESEAKKEISILEKEFSDLNRIKEIVSERIKTRKPLQYILGKVFFMDFELKITEDVLIPRPETELLIEETLRRVGSQPNPTGNKTIFDIGTGSGNIAIALAKHLPNSKIIAIDINEKIIELAKENAIKNNVNEKIVFLVCDVFSEDITNILKKNKFDLIISNPPYVKEGELKNLKPEVNLHEPKIALSGSKENKNGLIYYERIFELATLSRHCEEQGDEAISSTLVDCHARLASRAKRVGAKAPPRNDNKTMVALEIDPPLVNDLKTLLKKYNLNNFEIIKDYSKLDRYLFISSNT